MRNITIFLKELERCDVCDPTMNGGVDNLSYNGFTVGQSSASYEPYLRRLYQNAVEELLCLPADKSAILNAELLRIADCQRYFDVPSYECLVQHERDISIRYNQSLKQAVEFIRHILNCVEIQKSMLRDFDSLISKPEETNKMQAPESKEKEIKSDDMEKAAPLRTDHIIRGVKGLANHLQLGTTKAQSILNSKILQKNGIAYRVGKVWNIDGRKLNDALSENPDLLY